MMFEGCRFLIKNIHSDTIVEYTCGNKQVDFIIESIINRRLRDEIVPDKIFAILNSYIDYKGREFQEELYNRLVSSKNIILLNANSDSIDPLPLKIIHSILDMFDFEDVKNFIKRTNIIKPPSKLPTEFDELIETDEKGSREQTYLKEDYIELITLITILKATLGVIGEYASIKDTVLSSNVYKEYILFTFYATHPIFNTPAFQKIYESIEKLTMRLYNDPENTAIRIIEKTISKDILPMYVTALIVIQKLLLNSELLDNDVKNTITKIYNFASNKLKLNDTTSNIKIKRFNANEDVETMESESIMESYRVGTDLTIGAIEEYKIAFSDPFMLARWLNIKADDNTINEIVYTFKNLEEPLPIKESIYIASWLYKDIVDIRSFDYMGIEEILVALSIAFIYMWENDLKDLALIISSYASNVDVFKVNFSLHSKLDTPTKEKLGELFPNNKAIISTGIVKESSMIEDTISAIAKNLMSYNLVSIAPEMYLEEHLGTRLKEVHVPTNIRSILADYIIKIHTKNES